MDKDYECIVIGGGAAGLSAALVLGRARRKTLVVDAGEQSNRPDKGVGGLLGNDGTPPVELYERAGSEVDTYGSVERIQETIETARKDGEGFVATTGDGEELRAETMILATGMKYEFPDIPGVAELFGRDAFHCPFCHGWEARDGRIGVIVGNTPDAMRARLIQLWSDQVTVLTHGSDLDAEQLDSLEEAGIPVVTTEVSSLVVENNSLEAIRFTDGSQTAFDSVMVPITMRHRSNLATRLGAEVESKPGAFIVDPLKVDFLQKTSVPGLAAAGDIATQGAPSVAAAIAEGHRAASGVVHDIALG